MLMNILMSFSCSTCFHLNVNGVMSAVRQEEASQLVRLEQRLTELWERVEAGGRRAEQRHRDVLQLYTELQQMSRGRSTEEHLEDWLKGQVDHHLSQLRTELEQDRQQREQQDLLQQQSQSSRLQQLELQLQALAAQMEELQWRQEAPPTGALPAALSVGGDQQSYDALLAEVLAQVREQVQVLLYGNQLTVGARGDYTLPESFLQWLSQQYVSGAELQAALASLELRIVQNISQQREDVVRQSVLETSGAAGAALTQEDVQLMVTNALRLFSQDRTGRADFALESGGAAS
ncbi:hypothetical protein INR49_020198 [Caranx melampygus]|nr:hypothetical protein INR49_020198 [Caranx melampygus]